MHHILRIMHIIQACVTCINRFFITGRSLLVSGDVTLFATNQTLRYILNIG